MSYTTRKIINWIAFGCTIPATALTIFCIITFIIAYSNNRQRFDEVFALLAKMGLANNDKIWIIVVIVYGLGLIGVILSTITSGTLAKMFKISAITAIIPGPCLMALVYSIIGIVIAVGLMIAIAALVLYISLLLPAIPVGVSILLRKRYL